MNDWPTWLGALLAAFGLPIAVALFVRKQRRISRVLNQRGIKTTGHVVGVNDSGALGQGRTSRIAFRDAQGVEHSFLKPGNDGPGNDVVIIYDPDDPRVARITDRAGVRQVTWLAWRAAFALISAFAIALAWLWSLWYLVSYAPAAG